MSRTTNQQNPSAPCDCNLQEAVFHRIDESLRSITDVTLALDLVATLIDPLESGGRFVLEIERDQLSALVRIFNGLISTKLSDAQNALHTVIQQ
jgi:hypothetical protein